MKQSLTIEQGSGESDEEYDNTPSPDPQFDIIENPTARQQYEVNVVIEDYLDGLSYDAKEYSEKAKLFIAQYTGMGGLHTFGSRAEGQGILYEFYTPDKLAKMMWRLALKHGFNGGRVLEPAAGIGVFLKHVPASGYVDKPIEVRAIELNPVTAKILSVLYPGADVSGGKFEREFIVNNSSKKGRVEPVYELVIGNPPYGTISGGEEMGMGEQSYTKARTYDEYFISRGLDLLKKDGLLIYVIGAEARAGGRLWLDKAWTKTKIDIAKKSEVVDAYVLPSGVFERTGVISQIIVLRKTS